MTHPTRIPRHTVRIPAYDDLHGWAVLADQAASPTLVQMLSGEQNQVWPWLMANGFRYHVPIDAPIYLTPDGRTAYLERFLIRVPSPWNRNQLRAHPQRDRYILIPDRTDARRKLVGYPIARPLTRYAPTLAALIGADQ